MHNQPSESSNKPADVVLPLSLTLEEIYSGCQKQKSFVRPVWISGKPFHHIDLINVSVPPGVRNNAKIRFVGHGEIRPSPLENNSKKNGEDEFKGDLVFVIREIPHKIFKLEEDNLIYTQKVTLLEALTGLTSPIELQTLDDRKLQISPPKDAVIHPQYSLCVPNEGMTKLNEEETSHARQSRGNLIIQFEIVFPQSTSISTAASNELRQILNTDTTEYSTLKEQATKRLEPVTPQQEVKMDSTKQSETKAKKQNETQSSLAASLLRVSSEILLSSPLKVFYQLFKNKRHVSKL